METNELEPQAAENQDQQAEEASQEQPAPEQTPTVDAVIESDKSDAPKADTPEADAPDSATEVDSAAESEIDAEPDAEKSASKEGGEEASAEKEGEVIDTEVTDTEANSGAEGETEDEPAEPIEPPMYKIGKEDFPLTTVLESLLFVAELGIKPSQFAQALECPVEDVQVALKLLGDSYKADERGLRVQERSGRYTMVSTPIAAKAIEAFLELDLTTKLSGPALEALSVIAYRQPATRPQIEAVRGVDCGGVIKTLLLHEMIEEVGRLDAPGRPILYGVTDFFMQHFGLTELQDLPPLETSEADMLWAATQIAEDGGEGETIDEDDSEKDSEGEPDGEDEAVDDQVVEGEADDVVTTETSIDEVVDAEAADGKVDNAEASTEIESSEADSGPVDG